MEEAASQLAARISSLLPQRATVSLEWRDLWQPPAASFSGFRAALEREIRKSGIEISETAQPDIRLRVTMSRNIRGLLFVAEAISGDRREVGMMSWPAPGPTQSKPRFQITQRAMFDDSAPILDFLLLDSGGGLLALSPTHLVAYRNQDKKWIPDASVPIPLARPSPRDPRGRLLADASGFHAYLPGVSCNGDPKAIATITCVPENAVWQVSPAPHAPQAHWVADRNYLESPALSRFYSAAMTNDGPLVAGLDGAAYLGGNGRLPGSGSWGSDLVSIDVGCSTASVVLATGSGDRDTPDQAQVFEIVNSSVVPASEPLLLNGPVTALWPSESPDQISVVVHNLKTGAYEASRLDVRCVE